MVTHWILIGNVKQLLWRVNGAKIKIPPIFDLVTHRPSADWDQSDNVCFCCVCWSSLPTQSCRRSCSPPAWTRVIIPYLYICVITNKKKMKSILLFQTRPLSGWSSSRSLLRSLFSIICTLCWNVVHNTCEIVRLSNCAVWCWRTMRFRWPLMCGFAFM